MDDKPIFCSYIFPGYETDPLLFAESVRCFGGASSNTTIWMMTPDFGKPLAAYAVKRLNELHVRIIPFPVEREELHFFFYGELAGLAQAEALAAVETDTLIWMDANTIMVNEPGDLVLPKGKSFAYRPVHLLILGPRWETPLDPFWNLIYRDCGVPADRVFPMQPVAETVKMRPYFNAGLLALHPQHGLLRLWNERFQQASRSEEYQHFFQQDNRYEVFLHQALLTGVALSHFSPDEMVELPSTYNYPVHLFERDITGHRPGTMDELVTFRHEGFYEKANWKNNFPGSKKLKNWLEGQLAKISAG